MVKNNLLTVVIFGRTNVGKSTLFNCLMEKKQALVSEMPGTTRDSNIGVINWQRRQFKLVDTGGIIDTGFLRSGKNQYRNKNSDLIDIDAKVQKQARTNLERADLVLFLVDAQDGLMPQDRQMATAVKKILARDPGKAVPKHETILVANKADNQILRQATAEFNSLGLGEPIPVSAATGSGTGDLLDLIISKLPTEPTAETENQKTPSSSASGEGKIKNHIKVCIVGRPNVGKSSLVNKILGEDRIIVSHIPHTTREPQNIDIKYGNFTITFIDTAGLSRQGQKGARQKKLKNTLEKLSINKSLRALDQADIALLVIDSILPIGNQEQKIVDAILARNASLIIVANKWDEVKDRDTKKFSKYINSYLPFITWSPIHFCSALTGEKVNKLFDLILKIHEARMTQVSDNALGHFLKQALKKHRPARGLFAKTPHIYNLRQTHTDPPLFSLQIGSKETLQSSYVKYIANRLRAKFGFLGTPISIWVEKNRKIHGQNERLKM